jgi:predicted NAD/FAD-binding protein
MKSIDPEIDRLDRELADAQADELAAEAITLPDAAAVLARPLQEIEAAVEAGQLVVFDHHGRQRLPVWQLSSTAPPSPLPTVPALARSFGGDAIALSAWVQTPNPHLHGRTPGEALRAGEDERVNAALAALGAAAF